MKNRIISITMALVALFGVSLTVTAAQSSVMNLAGNEIVEINCDGRRLVVERTSRTQVTATCRPSNNAPTDPPADLAVIDLILVNADTDQDIGPLTDGATINFNELGTQNLSVRAETQPSTVGSVKFSLDDDANLQTENIAPYTIAGDNNGDYHFWTPSVGQHTLIATPYTGRNGRGTQGTALTVTFTVTDGSSEPEPEPTDPPANTDFDNWLDTGHNNSMTENDNLFNLFDMNGEQVFGTVSNLTNIHSHYVGTEASSMTSYEYTGRMMITEADGSIGITFFSQYPRRDAYYRLRRYNDTFHIAPHPHGENTVRGDIYTDVEPIPNVWYQFKIEVQDTGSQTQIRAKVWPANSSEPGDWQVNAFDNSSSRLTAGTIGVWSMGSGNKYWADLTTNSLPPSDDPPSDDPPSDDPPSDDPPSDDPPSDDPPSDDPPSSSTPLCEDHDPNAWHPLYDAEKNCHYDHEHKDDPHLVDDIFGPVGALYGGQEISYPWQTFQGAGAGFPESPGEDSGLMENDLKHNGYGWLVRRDIDCFSAHADRCITDFRLQFHAIMASPGAVTRFHSFWLEARGCFEDNPDECGIIRTGGWLDFGHLEIDGQHIPLPGDPEDVSLGSRRIHYYETGNSDFSTWYGQNGISTIAIQTSRMWGLIFPDDPYRFHLFCPDNECLNNGSNMQAHVIAPVIPNLVDDSDGTVNFDGYTNRYGEIVDNCTEVGLDCVPLQIINMPVGAYQYRDDAHGVGNGYLYDTSPPGEFWITYPN